MSEVFRTERRVEFRDTDAAGIAHFSCFSCYMEEAEHQLLRHLGSSVVQPLEDGWHLSWPRVHVQCDFAGTARFEDQLEISVQILKLGSKSVTYGFEFQCGQRRVASGKIVAVCCKVKSGKPLESIAIPNAFRLRLEPFVVD